ncbi:MAG: BTAD domain-containing putative transcriptional regulator [Acidimicrobiales bacterium]
MRITLLDRSAGHRPEAVPLEFRILGHLDVVRGGESLRLGGHRQRAILARLLVEPGRVVPRDRLIDDAWDGRPPPSAAKTLHKYVSELRRALDPPDRVGARRILLTVRQGYVADLDREQLDAGRFERSVAEASRTRRAGDTGGTVAILRAALDTWRGEVLADFPDSLFAAPERARLGELRLTALEQRLDVELALGHHGEVASELADLLDAHPLRERLWALYMTTLAESGRTAEALRAFQRFRQLLGADVGLEPSAELCELETRIVRGELAVAFTSRVGTRADPPGNLPVPLTTFIGREELLVEIEEALGRLRLVTLTGPGGSGKTRLGTEVARRVRRGLPGGAWLVDLAPLRDPAEVTGAVAAVLGIPAQPERSLVDVVADALAFRGPTLIVVDNCEHVAPACAELVAHLLGRCAELRVLATSRQPLGVPGEAVIPVPPLAVETEAAALFCDRARLARSGAAATPADPAVVELCRRLDGLPLAIELAASSVQVLEPSELAQRLGERLLRLEAPAPAADRHRSLRATMEWSLDLLSPGARTLFRRLGVFAGSFTLEAAEGVCSGDGLDRSDVLPLLTELLRNSLVGRGPQPTPLATRYSMLETLRTFAAELLDTSGEVETTRQRHLAVMVALAESARSGVLGPDELSWRQRLDLARHDIRVALQFAREREPLTGFALALALWPHWLVWGRFEEGVGQLRALLESAPEASPGLRAWAMVAAADLGADAGEVRRAMGWADEALAWFRRSGNARGEAYALRALANAQFNRGNFGEAARLLETAADRIDHVDDPVGRIHVAYLLGFVQTRRGQYEEAEATFWRSLRSCHEMGSRLAEARALWILGTVARGRGDDAAARELCERSLHHLLEFDDALSVARVRVILGDIVRLQGDDVRAGALYEEAMVGLRQVGDERSMASTLTGLGTIALRAGEIDRAGALFLESLAVRARLGDDAGLAECYEDLAATHRAAGQPRYAATLTAAADACRSPGNDPVRPSVADVAARWAHRRSE